MQEPPPGALPEQEDVSTRLLGRPRVMRRRQVSAAAGVSLLSARRFWHALGFPRVGDEDAMFTDADLEALASVVRLVRSGRFDESTALAMTRAVARAVDRLAIWQTTLVQEMITEEQAEQPAAAVAAKTADLLVSLADEMEPLIIYAWRRHLVAAITQMLAESRPDSDEAGAVRTVGFADMVDFTPLVRRLSERQLAHLVQRFYALASDVVTAHGGKVVKTIGDEVVFVTEGAAPAAAIALDLVDEMGEDPGMPLLRVGMATGQVTSQLGDVFGTTVNRASRLTAAARPGTVVTDDAMAIALTPVSGFRLRRLRTRTLRGLGPTRMWNLKRASETARRGIWDEGEDAPPLGDAPEVEPQDPER